jgi:hypothetical protein
MSERIDQHTIAHYLDMRHECAILAALRHLAQSLRANAVADPVIHEIMVSGGGIEPLSADEIDAYADALSSDTWLCEASSGPEAR